MTNYVVTVFTIAHRRVINHHNNCVKLKTAAIEMPASKADKVEFKNFNARAYAPVVIYFDLESLIIPIKVVKVISQVAGVALWKSIHLVVSV